MRLQPWIRRLLTRLIAIVPAFVVIYFFGEEKTGDLLVASQVILSLQLGFAIIPLIHFVSNKKRMGEFVIPMWQKVASWISVTVIVFLNCQMLVNKVTDWLAEASYPLIIWLTVVPFMVVCLGILLFIVFEPLFKKTKHEVSTQFHGDLQKITFEKPKPYSSIAVTVDFSTSDNKAINKALQLGGKEAHYVLIHILESTSAVMYGEETNDYERSEDSKNLLAYKDQLNEQGYNCEFKLGFGNPKSVIPTLVTTCDLLVMGTHGHTRFKDLLFGTTVEGVRHKITIPLVLV
jgi:manganese transport protein